VFYVVSYDIPETKRRTKLSKLLLNYGNRVQYSVFECIMDTVMLEGLVEKIGLVIDENDDSVRIYPLCAGCERTIKVIGQGEVTADKDVYIL
jgi:CRISPR-associated protein Cas2